MIVLMESKHKMQELKEAANLAGPLCVGLDTDLSYIPESVKRAAGSAEEAVLSYNKNIISRISADKSACCCKIQIAYYEAMGLKGLKIYAETLKAVKAAGMIAISDIKRGDIAATAAAYAKAHFSGDFETDIITVNPYMGFDTLLPFLEYASPAKGGKGIFVLLCTSNPGMTDLERQELKSGEPLFERVGDEISRINGELKKIYPAQTCGTVGAVVGATQEKDARHLRDKYPETFFLIPGYGAQGGDAKVAAILLEKCGGTVNSSRGILCAWKNDKELSEKRESGILTMEDIADSAARAAVFSKQDLLNARHSV